MRVAKLFAAGVVWLAIGGCHHAAQPADLRMQLEAVFDDDQRYRERIQDLMVKSGGQSEEGRQLIVKQQALDEANLAKMETLLRESGWPDQRVVGEKAAMAAFLVVQHTDPARQRSYLRQLREAVATGKARPEDLALLEDRVLIGEGKKQRYGSQLQEDGRGGWMLSPIEDEAHVDQRRKAVGLGPLAEYAAQFGIKYRRK